MGKYGGLSLYEIHFEKIYFIDDKDIHFVKWDVYAFISNSENIDGTSTDHEYFLTRDDFFDRILETDHNSDIVLQVINKDVSFSSINDNGTGSSSKLRKRSENFSPCHHLQRKRQLIFIIININRLIILS